MRRRRAERCILRAEVAAEAGALDDAREALAEARKLAPGWAEIDTVEARLFPPVPLDAPARQRSWPRRVLYVAAALGSIAVLSMGITWWQRTSPAKQPPVASKQVLPSSTAVTTPKPDRVASRDVHVETVSITAMSINDSPAPVAPTPTMIEARTTTPEPRLPMPEPRGTSGTEPALTAPLASPPPPEPAPSPRAAERDIVIDRPPVADVPVAAVRNLELPSSERANTAASLPTTPAPRVDERLQVQSVLHKYADAYSRLDASAAQQVYPNVNRAALSRAFDGLASQDVSLGNCAVDVSGASARATCAGAATWAPKIGSGGPRTEPRSWTFQLAKAGADWQIVNARVQNR